MAAGKRSRAEGAHPPSAHPPRPRPRRPRNTRSSPQLLVALASSGAPLQHLSLPHSRVTDAGLAAAAASFASTLASLRLGYCRAVTDAGLDALKGAPALASLDLYQVPAVTPELVAELVG
jgi:hypothetical protein